MLDGGLFRRAVFEAGAACQTVSLPVAGILPVMTTALGAGVDPDGLTSWNDPAAGRIDIAVRTFLAFRAAFARLVDGVDTRWRSAICNQTAGNAIIVTSALLTLRRLEVLTQVVHLSPILTPYLLAPGTAVGGVVADMDACSRERGALSPGARRALGGTLTLGAVIRVQKIPFPHVVYAAVGLAGALLLPGYREAKHGLCAKEDRRDGRAYCAHRGKALI